MMFVRENFFQFFDFHLLEGNPETLLANENNIVLTRSCAIKLFGTEHALGKTLIEQAFGDRRCTVSGIIEDIDNSIFLPILKHSAFIRMCDTLIGVPVKKIPT